MPIAKRSIAEFVGTFWLVFGGCGSAVLSAGVSRPGDRLSGSSPGLRPDRPDHGLCHRPHLRLPPQPGRLGGPVGRQAVPRSRTWFPTSSPRWPAVSPPPRSCTLIASGKAGFSLSGGFASNGYGDHSPGGYTLTGLLGRRGGPDLHVPDGHPGRHRQAGAAAASPPSPSAWA